jgi:hypothetical protein
VIDPLGVYFGAVKAGWRYEDAAQPVEVAELVGQTVEQVSCCLMLHSVGCFHRQSVKGDDLEATDSQTSL